MTSAVEIRGSFAALIPFVGILFAGAVEDDAAETVGLSEARLAGAMLRLLIIDMSC
jgi:hypothetical protein